MLAVDVGGTFTDVVALKDGKIETTKVSTDYGDVTVPVLQGAAAVGVDGAAVFNHASTHGLNAIITRNLPKIGFLTTEGHRDILDMGRVWRPAEAILDPHWRRSFGDAARPLVPRYLRRGIRERMLADGTVLIDLDEEQARQELRVLERCGVAGVAICLLNSYVNPAHELRLRELVREELGDEVACSISSEISPLAKEYPRASTTAIDTFMKIIYGPYSQRLLSGLRDLGFEGQLNFADCAATLVQAERAMEDPFRIVFSGPAAGTVASAHFGSLIGKDKLLCADVGGTSCDISVVTNGQPNVDTTFELEHDLLVNALANEIAAIGAGGGSLVTIGKSGEIRVGPGSAGADPGPACYGRGGVQPTTTDTCLMIGILEESGFAGGSLQLDKSLAQRAFEGLACDFTLAQRVRYAYEMAIQSISEGLFNVAIRNGIDPRDYSLIAYGAAGPMLLPATMETLHCKEVIVPPYPGLFSALGLLSTNQVFTVSRSSHAMLESDSAEAIDEIYAELEGRIRSQLDDGVQVDIERTFDGHLLGQSWDTPFVPAPVGTIDADAVKAMVASFHDAYGARSGNRFEQYPVQGVTFRVRAVLHTEKVEYPQLPERGADVPLEPIKRTTLSFLQDTAQEQVPVYDRLALLAGDVIEGPAIVQEALSTTHIGAGQSCLVGRYGELTITRK
jgi:N-methylhydantoinase A